MIFINRFKEHASTTKHLPRPIFVRCPYFYPDYHKATRAILLALIKPEIIVNRWSLSQTCGSSHAALLGSKANNSIFHFFTCDHHQVRQLVDNDRSRKALVSPHQIPSATLALASKVSAYFREELVAIFHLINDLSVGLTANLVRLVTTESRGEEYHCRQKAPPSLDRPS